MALRRKNLFIEAKPAVVMIKDESGKRVQIKVGRDWKWIMGSMDGDTGRIEPITTNQKKYAYKEKELEALKKRFPDEEFRLQEAKKEAKAKIDPEKAKWIKDRMKSIQESANVVASDIGEDDARMAKLGLSDIIGEVAFALTYLSGSVKGTDEVAKKLNLAIRDLDRL